MPAEPRTTIVRSVGTRSQAASSWSVPITLTSCIARGDIPGPGWRTICSWTIVSTPGRRDQPPDLRVADVGLDELGALEGDLRAARVEAGHVLDLGVALEPLREEAPDVAAHAGDQHPAAGH